MTLETKAPVESATVEAEGVSGRRGGGATVVEEEAEDVTKTPRRHGVEEEARPPKQRNCI